MPDKIGLQIGFLRNTITLARTGDEESISLLRRICASAAVQIPLPDLIAMGEYLVSVGIEVAPNEND